MKFNKRTLTIAVAALLFIGAGSAALLSSFGTVDGTAEVQQAVTLNDADPTNPQTQFDYAFNGEQTAGETVVETHTLNNNANVSTEVAFESSCDKDGATGSESVTTSTSVDWSDECKGIDTDFVEYYDDAGHDFDDYEPPTKNEANHTVEDGGSIQNAVDVAKKGQTILIKSGTYEESVNVTTDGLTLAGEEGAVLRTPSDSGPSSETVPLRINADGVTVEGLNIENLNGPKAIWISSTGNVGESDVSNVRIAHNTIGPIEFNTSLETGQGDEIRGIDIRTSGSDITIAQNTIQNLEDTAKDGHSGSAITAFIVESADDPLTDLTITNNVIDGFTTADTGWTGARGIHLNAYVDDAEISHNTIKNLGEGSQNSNAKAISITEDGDADPRRGPQNFEVKYNDLQSVSATESEWSIFVGGYEDLGDSHVIESNNMADTLRRWSEDQERFNPDDAHHVNADNNWWGTSGIQTDGFINASWETKTDLTVEAGSSDKFGVVNDFAINLQPDSYTITTDVVPAGDDYEEPDDSQPE